MNKKLLRGIAVIICILIIWAGLYFSQVLYDVQLYETTHLESINEADLFTIYGSILYLIDSSGVIFVDISGETIESVGRFDDGDDPKDIDICNKDDQILLLIADRKLGLKIVDATDPSSPLLLSIYEIEEGGHDVAIHGDIAYLASWEKGISILNISNPNNPTILNTIQTQAACIYVKIIDDLLISSYHYSDYTGITIYDISNLSNPIEYESYEDRSKDLWSPIISGNYLIAANHKDTGSLVICKKEDDSTYVELVSYVIREVIQEFEVVDTIIFIATFEGSILIVDFSNPEDIQISGRYYSSGEAKDLQYHNDHLYVSDRQKGLMVFEVNK
ncbi:MAG: hypothetical protein INQ03_21835 [Candidatus Heimdallarchaeota archaeon]|nr:hypothetical protein [Candidatus Heimdallarchaeota archaeon]